MITIRTVTELLTLGYLVGLSVYDIRYKRVTNTSLLLLLPVVFLIGITEIRSAGDMLSFLLGGLSGGGILLAAAMATKGGIGGGDIKLMTLLGLMAGLYDMLLILMTASVLALLYGTAKRIVTHDKSLHIAFVPFLTLGYAATLIPIL